MKETNKQTRKLKMFAKLRKRLRLPWRRTLEKQHAFKSTGTPCSCVICDPHKREYKDRHSVQKRMPPDDGE